MHIDKPCLQRMITTPAKRQEKAAISQGEPAIGEVDLSCRVARLIRGEVDGESCHFFCGSEASHGLAIYEGLPRRRFRDALRFGQCCNPLVERG